MSLLQTVEYTVPDDFTFDTDQIEVEDNVARLKLVPNTGQTFSQAFGSDTDFVYDSAKTEFVAGVIRQIDQRPAGATFFASFATSVNADWANGDTTGTVVGGAAIVGGKLDLTGGNKNVSFAGLNNVSTAITKGAVRVRYTPNYNGTPSSNQVIFSIGDEDSNNNTIQFLHLTNGSLFMYVNDENGNNILSNSILSFDAVAGETGELEVNWDLDAGKFYVFGSGFLIAEIDVTMSRNSSNLLRLGSSVSGAETGSDHFIEHVVVFDEVQHTTGYTSPLSLPDTIYSGDVITLPEFEYSGLGVLQAFTTAAITQTGAPRYIMNGRYWNGSAWVVSNNSYAQASTSAQVISNISTLTAADSLIVKVVTDSSNTQATVDLMTVAYTGQIYPTINPTITVNSGLDTDGLLSFVADYVGNVQFVLLIGGVPKYWNGSAWVTSNNTYAQSNTATDIHANLEDLDLSLGVTFKLRAFLNSDGSSSPTLESAEIGYNFFIVPVAEPNRCIVFAFLNDMLGIVGSDDSAVLIVELLRPFEHGERIILPFKRTFVFTALGYVESGPDFLLEADSNAGPGLIETESVGLSPYILTLQYINDSGRRVKYKFKNVQIPNGISVNLVDLVTF